MFVNDLCALHDIRALVEWVDARPEARGPSDDLAKARKTGGGEQPPQTEAKTLDRVDHLCLYISFPTLRTVRQDGTY